MSGHLVPSNISITSRSEYIESINHFKNLILESTEQLAQVDSSDLVQIDRYLSHIEFYLECITSISTAYDRFISS